MHDTTSMDDLRHAETNRTFLRRRMTEIEIDLKRIEARPWERNSRNLLEVRLSLCERSLEELETYIEYITRKIQENL